MRNLKKDEKLRISFGREVSNINDIPKILKELAKEAGVVKFEPNYESDVMFAFIRNPKLKHIVIFKEGIDVYVKLVEDSELVKSGFMRIQKDLI